MIVGPIDIGVRARRARRGGAGAGSVDVRATPIAKTKNAPPRASLVPPTAIPSTRIRTGPIGIRDPARRFSSVFLNTFVDDLHRRNKKWRTK
jgi:hypothetical protein